MLAVVVICALVIVTLMSTTTVGDAPGWVKGVMCMACHKALNPDLVNRYQATKHARVLPTAEEETSQEETAEEPADSTTEEIKPVDVYRRSVGYVAEDNSFFEPGVGCQACHGPGAAHLAAKTKEKAEAIVRPEELETSTQKLSVCGRCHGQYTVDDQPFALNFEPGDDLFALEGFQLAEVEEPGPFQELNELQVSKHVDNDVTCITCHTAHGKPEPEPQFGEAVSELCLECHVEEHQCTVAPESIPEGADCATCHMPESRHVFVVDQ